MTFTTLATLAHAARPRRGMVRLAVTLAGVIGLAALATQACPAPTAHAAGGLHYQRGYSVQHGWLCYGWANGAYHCTQHWTRRNGQLISLNPAWVPSAGFSAPKASAPTRMVATRAVSTGGGGAPVGSISRTPGGISAWAYTGHPAYAMSDFRGDPYGSYFGACTWYAWYRHQNEPLMRLGMASQWTYNAPRFGLRVGSTPAVGATAVFQPGVQGASGGGHAAHVEAVYGGGWFLVSEMSFYWNGGGWGRVSYRYAHTGPGVAFIY